MLPQTTLFLATKDMGVATNHTYYLPQTQRFFARRSMENGVENSAGPKKLEARRIFFGSLKRRPSDWSSNMRVLGSGSVSNCRGGGGWGSPPL